jgi:hypothetical protein
MLDPIPRSTEVKCSDTHQAEVGRGFPPYLANLIGYSWNHWAVQNVLQCSRETAPGNVQTLEARYGEVRPNVSFKKNLLCIMVKYA